MSEREDRIQEGAEKDKAALEPLILKQKNIVFPQRKELLSFSSFQVLVIKIQQNSCFQSCLDFELAFI